MTGIIIAACAVGVTGLLLGLFLGFMGKKFAVEVDQKEIDVRGELPGNNCGGCGYAGCDGLAKAIANGEAPVNGCPVGGAAAAEKISAIMGVEAGEFVKKVAFVKCAGTCDKAKSKYKYAGNEDCVSAMSVPGGGEESEKIDLGCYLDNQSSPWWNYVMGLPGMAISWLRSLFVDEDESDGLRNNKSGTIELTKEENEKITSLKKNIAAVMDKKTAITNVSVTLQDPKVAAVVADSVVHKLQEYITDYRTFKAKEDCAYLEKLFKERREEYYAVQKKYAEYVDTHDNLILQSIRAEQERLQNDMSLAYQVYSQVANQLQVARAKVQEEKPVFAVVEPAVVPQQPSGTSRKTYVIAFVFLFVATAIGWKFFGEDFWDRLKREFV